MIKIKFTFLHSPRHSLVILTSLTKKMQKRYESCLFYSAFYFFFQSNLLKDYSTKVMSKNTEKFKLVIRVLHLGLEAVLV